MLTNCLDLIFHLNDRNIRVDSSILTCSEHLGDFLDIGSVMALMGDRSRISCTLIAQVQS